MSDINVVIQDKDQNNKGLLDEYLQLDAVPRFNDVGSWAVSLPRNAMGDVLALRGSRILIEGFSDKPISGPMNRAERAWDSSSETYVLSGFTDEIYLHDHLVYPSEPVAASGTAFSGDDYDVATGLAEVVMKHYVRVNATAHISAWDVARAVDGLSIAALHGAGLGLSVVGRGRLQTVLEMEQQLAIAGGGLGFEVNDMVFDVYEPRDLTNEAVFSVEVGNLGGYRHVMTSPEVTHPVVAGGGQGIDRTFQLGGDDAVASLWNRRIESLRDRRDTEDPAELLQQFEEELAEKGEKTEVSIRPVDTAGLQFGRDYYLGDLVTVEDVAAVVTQVPITLDGNGRTITPSVNSAGTAAAMGWLKAFDALRKLTRRVGGLERTL